MNDFKENVELLAQIGPLRPITTYEYYDFPVLFSTRDTQGNLNLVLWYERPSTEETVEPFDVFLVTPVPDEVFEELNAKSIDVFTAMTRGGGWLVKIPHGNKPWSVAVVERVLDLPRDSLPNDDYFV